MAAGKGRTRTADAERAAEAEQGPQTAEPERTAHAWEFDESDSWEPVVPDTWEVPADRHANEPVEPAAEASAGWSDAARTEEEWVDAARHSAGPEARPVPAATGGAPYLQATAPDLGDEPAPARGPGHSAVPSEQAGETAGERPDTEEGPAGPSTLRMALGLASMAAQRLRGGVPAGDEFVTGVGLVQETAVGLRELGRRVLGPASRVATDVVRGAAMLPVAGAPVRAALKTREKLAAAVADAQSRGHEAVEAGRADAERILRERTDRAVRWATDNAVGPLVDRLAPRVAEHLVPQIISEITHHHERGSERDAATAGRREAGTGGRRRR